MNEQPGTQKELPPEIRASRYSYRRSAITEVRSTMTRVALYARYSFEEQRVAKGTTH